MTIVGDGKDNEIGWWGWEAGPPPEAPVTTRSVPLDPVHVCGAVSFDASGGPGDDRLTGSKLHDLLDGGPGRDRADGGPANDTCLEAEVLRSCERT